MKKILNHATPLSILLNIILLINVVIVLYPVLFTISSSLTLSSSLAATSVIPFTDEKDISSNSCKMCYGVGKTIDNTKTVKIRDLYRFIPDEDKRMEFLQTLSSQDPYKAIIVSETNGTTIALRLKSPFDQDEIADNMNAYGDVDKIENKKLVREIYTDEECSTCKGSGIRYCSKCDGKGSYVKKGYLELCDACEGTGKVVRLVTGFKFKKPSLYQFKRLLTSADKYVEGGISGKKVLGTNYKHWYFNTLKVAVFNTIITVFVCTMAGYIFSRFSFTGRKQIMASMIILQMFPSFIGMVATYVILWKFNALNTLWGLILVYSAGSIPFNSQLMKGYFDTMSKDIAEAAYIDGATPLGAFIRVILPAAKPQLVFLALTSFTGPWMDYIFPRLILRSDDKKTLAVGLYEMISGRANDNFTMFAAGAILVAVPFAIIFMAGQKSLLTSLAGTSGKE